MPRWVFQEDIIDADIIEGMTAFMTAVGIPWNRIKMVPFTRDLTQEKIDPNQPLIAIGSYDFTYKAIELGWKPGVWVNENYDFSVWGQSPWKLLNSEGTIYEFGDLPFQQKPFFLRPAADNKLFTGTVMDWGKYTEWYEKLTARERDSSIWDLKLDSPVVLAPARKIVAEYRVIVVDGRPITASLYKQGTIGMRQNADHLDELFEFAQSQVDLWKPSDVFVLDVAMADGEYHVVEMGNFNAAGLYHCDLQRIVIAVEELCS